MLHKTLLFCLAYKNNPHMSRSPFSLSNNDQRAAACPSQAYKTNLNFKGNSQQPSAPRNDKPSIFSSVFSLDRQIVRQADIDRQIDAI